MENLQKIAMLIDADNTQLAKLEAVIQEVNTLGRIVVKRAYGNWKKDALKRWEGEIRARSSASPSSPNSSLTMSPAKTPRTWRL